MAANKTIKFFISSTFKDFLKERNALQNFVFPRLKKLCNDQGFYFQPVDLRWGVTEESSEDNKTMDYCLNEVKRCSHDPKPNLLILLGQRYGWGPLPSYLTVKEYNYIVDFYSPPKSIKGFYIKHYPCEVQLLNKWYKQDKNDSHKKYFLKDKKGLDRKEWENTEKELKSIIQTATKDKEYDKDYTRFHTSATEQEIKYALNEQYKANSDNTLVYFREFIKGSTEQDLIEGSQSAKDKLNDLKGYLEDSSIDTVKQENIDINAYLNVEKECNVYDELSDDLKYFCDEVLEKCEKKILQELDSFTKQSSLKIELDEQKEFLEKKSAIVLGREDEVEAIKEFATSDNDRKYYLLHGKSGSGKTSVMARALLELNNEKIIYRFIGTTAHTTSPRDTYEYIYWQMVDKNSENKPNDIEHDDQKFYLQFQEALQTYSQDKKITLFIDAVDQFNIYDNLEIFLHYIPDNVKVVFSCLYDEEKSDNQDYVTYFNVLKHIERRHELKALDIEANVEILEAWLSNTGRTLQEEQLTVIKENVANKSPLFLRLTYEIVREWTANNSLEENRKELGDTEEELIIKFFENVVNKHYVKNDLLEITLGLISASKDGLSESELIDVLSNEKGILSLYEREGSSYPKLEKLPDSIFSKMYYHIQDIFTEKLIDDEMLINPYHRIIEEVIKKEFYEKKRIELHTKLADYFYVQQDKTKTWDKRYNNLHMLDEYPYQLFHSKNSKQLKEILFDLEFAGSVYDNYKQDSFRGILEKATTLEGITKEEIYPWESFYREKEFLILRLNYNLWKVHQSLFQLAYEDGENSPLNKAANDVLDKNNVNWYWFKNTWCDKVYYRQRLVKVITYTHKIEDVFSLSGDRLFINSNGLHILHLDQYENEIIDTIDESKKIFCNNQLNHVIPEKLTFAKYNKYNRYFLYGRNSRHNRILKLSDDTYLSWESYHKAAPMTLNYDLMIRDIDGNILSIIDGHKGSPYYVIEFDDGNICSMSADTIKIWNKHGVIKYNILHKEIKEGKFVSLNYRLGKIIYSSDKKVYVYDLSAFEMMEESHMGTIAEPIVLSNNSILTYSADKTIKIWDDNTLIHTLKGHSGSILGVQEHNKKLYSYGEDGIVKTWSLDGVNLQTYYIDHKNTNPGKLNNMITNIYIFDDGTFIASGRNYYFWTDSSVKPKRMRSYKAFSHELDFILMMDKKRVIYIHQRRSSTVNDIGRKKSCKYSNTFSILPSDIIFKGHTENIEYVIELSNGKIVSSSIDNQIIIWNDDATVLKELHTEEDILNIIALSDSNFKCTVQTIEGSKDIIYTCYGEIVYEQNNLVELNNKVQDHYFKYNNNKYLIVDGNDNVLFEEEALYNKRIMDTQLINNEIVCISYSDLRNKKFITYLWNYRKNIIIKYDIPELRDLRQFIHQFIEIDQTLLFLLYMPNHLSVKWSLKLDKFVVYSNRKVYLYDICFSNQTVSPFTDMGVYLKIKYGYAINPGLHRIKSSQHKEVICVDK